MSSNQNTTDPSAQKESWEKKYFGWLSPLMIIWFVIAFLLIIAAIATVGSGFCSVAEFCGNSSYTSTTQLCYE